MSNTITKKERNLHNRDPKNVVLVITSDKSIKKDDVYEQLNLLREKTSIVLLKTDLTGKSLNNAVIKYMHDIGMNSSRGDSVIFFGRNEITINEKGGVMPMGDIQLNIEKRF